MQYGHALLGYPMQLWTADRLLRMLPACTQEQSLVLSRNCESSASHWSTCPGEARHGQIDTTGSVNIIRSAGMTVCVAGVEFVQMKACAYNKQGNQKPQLPHPTTMRCPRDQQHCLTLQKRHLTLEMHSKRHLLQ